LDIEDLRTFLEVANAGGVSPAARRLGMTKSNVSRRLARLEEGLGVQLLSRNTRGAALTDAGMTFRDYASKACSEIDAAKEIILPTGSLRGRLRIAAPLPYGPTHISEALTKMAQRHPELQIHTVYSDRIVDLITEGFDCAIRVGALQDSTLIARGIGSITGALVASPSYIKAHGAPEHPDQIIAHRALLQGTEPWRFIDGDQILTVNARGRFKADNAPALAAAAVAGLGIAWLPTGIIQDHLASGALVKLMAAYPPPPARVYIVRPPGQYLARKVRVLTDLLIECFGLPAEQAKFGLDLG
jgi:DNA-binding transcriptional LysR family regulator